MTNASCEQLQRALEEWITALDVLDEPIFLHDASFRIIRCNRAYQQKTGLSFQEIIGQYYYDVFPKSTGPLPQCKMAKEVRGVFSADDEIDVDGTVYHSRAYVINDQDGNYRYSIHILEDISKRKSYEERLQTEKLFSEKLVESIPDIFFLIDDGGRLLRWNSSVETMFGLSGEELDGYDALELVHPDDREYIRTQIIGALDSGRNSSEVRLLTRRGVRHYTLTSQQIDIAQGRALIGIGIDITASRKAAQEIRYERDFNRNLVETAQAIILILDPQGKIVRFNPYMESLSGYTLDDVKGKDWVDTFLPEPNRKRTKKLFADAIKDIQTGVLQLDKIQTRDGRILQIEWFSKTLRDIHGTIEGLLSIGMDVTDKRKTEERLELFHTLFDQSMDAVEIVDIKTLRLLDVNETESRQLGYSREELLNMTVREIDPTMSPAQSEKLMERFRKTKKIRFESVHRRQDGTLFPVEISASLIERDRTYLLSIVRDISERIESDAALKRANRALRTLSEVNTALVHAQNETELLDKVTKVIVEQSGYSLAAVYLAADGDESSLVPVTWAGYRKKRYWIEQLRLDEPDSSDFPAGRAVKMKTTQICRSIDKNAGETLWGKTAVEHGYISNISLPLFNGNEVFGVLGIYASLDEPFDEDEVKLLEELAQDLAYGILNLRTRVSQEQHETLLRESLEQSIQAIAATVESRDPYTAGHQRRVAELAAAIAREMELDEERIQGISFAGIIHDLGKIHIPAEILSKPGRLSDIEYQLIQTHPQAGYDIVKDVRFPWPIAQIILQHHERVDGTGYPQGLKGNEILLEARIISIADTVDAISSHRPYRSARGIETAIQEIQKGKGSIYDPEAVDACVRLFNEKAFTFTTDTPLPPLL
ncbi:PAS domain S-box protein [Thiomicrolovo sp. ZZH C-3]